LEGIYALLNNNEMLYPILFDFAEPWKIDLLDFLNDNYMDDLSMEQIASFTGRSLATFKRDFKKISNLTPQKWLIKKRLEMAYIKLKEENKKVQDVCTEVGFKNLSHFSTAFKKQYGIPPTEI
jgi:AraC-like DNA-binding protein